MSNEINQIELDMLRLKDDIPWETLKLWDLWKLFEEYLYTSSYYMYKQWWDKHEINIHDFYDCSTQSLSNSTWYFLLCFFAISCR